MTIANNQDAIAYGIKAGAAWANGDKQIEAGLANATIAIYLAARTMTFSCTVERKDADKKKVMETNDFDVSDWNRGAFNANGSKDIKLMAARTIAVAAKLFNISSDAVTAAVKTRLDRALEMAMHLAKQNATMTDEQYKSAVVLKKSDGKECLAVPYTVMNDAPKADADEDVIDEYNANKARTVPLNGKKGNSLAELGKRAKPEVVKRAPATVTADAGKSLLESIALVSATVQTFNNKDGESSIAPTKDMDKQLFDLQVQLAAYFAANPLEEAKPAKPATNKKAAA